MSLEVEGVYENGVLKPDEPLALNDHERVVITVRPKTSRIRRAAGMIRWSGSREVLRKIAEDPILDESESP